MTLSVYKITNKVTGDIYIGQTRHAIKERWKSHCKPSNVKHSRYLAFAIKKYGKESFSVESLGEYDALEDLDDAECYFISLYNSLAPNGYNLTGGGNARKQFHPETIKKLSAARKGQHNSPATEFKPGPRPELRGEANPAYGITPRWAKRVICVETGETYASVAAAAKAVGVMRSYLSRLLSGKSRGHRAKGKTFVYAEIIS